MEGENTAYRLRSQTDMISESLDYLRKSDDWVTTLIIGGIVAFFSFLLIPAFWLMGYLMRVLRATMHGNDERVPRFSDWTDLTVDGLKAFVIALVYGLIPAIVGGIVMTVGGVGLAASNSSAGAIAGGLVLLVGGLLTLVLGLLAWYLIPAALMNYADKGTVGAGFAFGDIRPMLSSGTYATGWLYALGLLVVAGVITSVLNVVPFLGIVVGAFVGFYAAVAAYYIYGRTWAEMHPVEMREEQVTGDRPAI